MVKNVLCGTKVAKDMMENGLKSLFELICLVRERWIKSLMHACSIGALLFPGI